VGQALFEKHGISCTHPNLSWRRFVNPYSILLLAANAYCKGSLCIDPPVYLIGYMLHIKPSRFSISSCIVFAGQVKHIANDEYTFIDCFTASFLQTSIHAKASPSNTCATVLLAARPSCTWSSLGCSSYPESFPTNNSHVVHNEIHDIPREVR